MTFLKKLGQILLAVAGAATGIGPVLSPFLGSGKAREVESTATNDLTAMGQIVVQIETAFAAVGNSTGAQKLEAATPLVANIVKTSELVAGKKIANEKLFIQACQEFTQAMVDLLNSIHPEEAKTT